MILPSKRVLGSRISEARTSNCLILGIQIKNVVGIQKTDPLSNIFNFFSDYQSNIHS